VVKQASTSAAPTAAKQTSTSPAKPAATTSTSTTPSADTSLPHFPYPTILRSMPAKAVEAAGPQTPRPDLRAMLERARLGQRLRGLMRGERQPAWLYALLADPVLIVFMSVMLAAHGSRAPAATSRAEEPVASTEASASPPEAAPATPSSAEPVVDS